MILIVSVCREQFSEREFVAPVAALINKKHKIIHYTKIKNLEKYEKIIICGTAVQDFAFLDNFKKFSWLKTIDKPVLGICAGMQILGLLFGAKLVSSVEIGMTKIKILKDNPLLSFDLDHSEFEAYNLHSCSLEKLDNFDILARSSKTVQALKHKTKPFYGLLSHPEVRNQDIIKRFVELD